MKIDIIGGGPGGLYFAILMKLLDDSSTINVYERNGKNDTFGWGVVFSGRTMDELQKYDARSHHMISNEFETWDTVHIVHRGERIIVKGNPFNGISRLRMLNLLQDRCDELGITIHYQREIQSLDEFPDADLIVAADGVNSIIRSKYADRFSPDISRRTNKYIWYGTDQKFDGLTLTFRENEHGQFAAHSYRFSKDKSTFVVECSEDVWRRAGLDTMNESASRAYIENVFADDLGGYPLLSNRSLWINFLLVKNRNWTFDNVVILGDACHTAHFSIGSGTKLALDDAIELYNAFKRNANVTAALQDYCNVRMPQVDEYQEAAYKSLLLFEDLAGVMKSEPLELAWKMMLRSSRVTPEKLAIRDPEFTERCRKAGLL